MKLFLYSDNTSSCIERRAIVFISKAFVIGLGYSNKTFKLIYAFKDKS